MRKIQLYFGVGLCNQHQLSRGLPIDVLGILLASEKIGTEKHILIADTHAKGNGFDSQQVDALAEIYKNTLLQTCRNLGLVDWTVMRASEIDQNEDYLKIFGSIKEENEYIKRELADMAWFVRHKKVTVKLGWAADKNLSELYFDKKFGELVRDPLFFLYVGSGRTFDSKRQSIAPYFCDNRDSRILLEPGENVKKKMALAEKKFAKKGVDNYKVFLKDLIDFYETVISPLEGELLEEKLQQVVERCCK